MEAKRIKNEADYEAALEKVALLMSAKAGTPEGDALDLWSFLVEDYEKRAYPIGMPDPVEAIRFRMEQQELKPADLEPFIGNKSKVSEVLGRKRPLSLTMIRRLHEGLGIPAEVLLRKPGGMPSSKYKGVTWRAEPASLPVLQTP
jgi:HTH-type transcriptional regulator / antitoxin HigA